jgi:hypothetical protein
VAARYAGSADPLWSAELRRNRRHAAALLGGPALIALLAWLLPSLGPVLLLAGLLFGLGVLHRSAQRCRWKCPDSAVLAWCYALHSHLQQIPILLGQWRWWRLQRRQQAPSLIEYRRATR